MTSPALSRPRPAHNRITLTGVFGSAAAPNEIWSWGICTQPRGFDVPGGITFATKVSTAYTTHIAPLMRPNVVLTRIRVSQHADGGATAVTGDGSYLQTDLALTTAGTSATGGQQPYSAALCVTLLSARAGATGRGRFFLPFPGRDIQVDGMLSESNANGLTASLKSFLDAINEPTNRLAVVSSKMYLSNVTKVRVGRVPDTMRSRRSSQIEGNSIATLAVPA